MINLIKRIFSKKLTLLLFVLIASATAWFILSRLEAIQAQGQVRLYFSPDTANIPPDAAISLRLDASGELIGFVRAEVNFDQTKVALTQEPVITPLLGTSIEVTSRANANGTGNIVIVLGLSPNDEAPTGDFELAQLVFTSLTDEPNQSTNLTVNEAGSQIVDTSIPNPYQLSIITDPALLVLNFTPTPTPTETPIPTATLTSTSTPMPTPTSTLAPSPTATPTPVLTATPAQSSASLSLVLNDKAFIDEEISIDVNFETNSPVSGVDAVILFDPAFISVMRIDDKKLLGDESIMNIDNAGIVRISQLEAPGTGFIGQGVMATLIVQSQTIGQKNLSFEFTPPGKADSNAVEFSTGYDILSAVNNLNFEIIDHPLLDIQLLTLSENAALGHSADGNLQTSDGIWSTAFSTDVSGSGEVAVPDSYIEELVELVFKVNGYLRKRRSFIIDSGKNNVDLGVLVAGDLNDDGIVNNIDLSLMYDAWFGSGTADYNRDGIVNSVDHWILTNNFFAQDE